MTVAFSHVSIDETVTPDLTDIFMGASVRQGWAWLPFSQRLCYSFKSSLHCQIELPAALIHRSNTVRSPRGGITNLP